MNLIVEVNEDGALQLPDEILEAIKPNSRFVVQIQDKKVVLSPVEEESQSFSATATSEEQIKSYLEWSHRYQDNPQMAREEALLHENKELIPLWAKATPEERVKYFRDWARSHKDSPNLPSEALRRENMYD